ncbi:transglutaminaseTgpA domain-containing protein [Actinomycetota bacterium]
MTRRVRPVDALLAALATLAAAAPLRTLFAPDSWIRPAIVVVAVVTAIGMLARRFSRSTVLVVLAQLLALVLATCVLHGRGHTFYGLPTPDTVKAYGVLLGEAVHTIQSYAAPAPATRGISLFLGLVVGLVAIAVDAIAVTRRTPAAAGLPLLAAYLITAANTGTTMSWPYFAAPAALWLLLLGRSGIGGLRRWSAAATGTARDSDGLAGFVSAARLLGVGALVLSLALTPLVPHLPTRFLADGLGRVTDSGRGGSGSVRVTSSIDVTRNLGSRSTQPVLRYRTDADRPAPLRVDVLDRMADGVWTSTAEDGPTVASAGMIAPEEGSSAANPERVSIDVDRNDIAPPQLAAPYPPISIVSSGGAVRQRDDLTLTVDAPVPEYRVQYLAPDPSAENLNQPLSSGATVSDRFPGLLEVDEASRPSLEAFVDEVVPEGATRLQAAQAIQRELRSGPYSYSLELAGPTEDGLTAQSAPIEHFLTTRQGYCVQFTSTMVMAARILGIPARMAVGFLPGTLGDERRYVVKAADAHAWPELYFEGVGWLRFEPTPGARSGVAPEYSIPAAAAPTASATTSTPTQSATASPTRRERPDQETRTASADRSFLESLQAGWTTLRTSGPLGWLATLAVLGCLGVLLLPLAAAIARWRARRRAADDAARAELEWQSLVSRLGDLGIEADRSATPRQAGTQLAQRGYLRDEGAEALGRVVGTLERARYARPGTDLPDLGSDADTVVRAVSRTRRLPDRLGAWLLPSEGFEAWGRLGRRLLHPRSGRRH